MNIKKISQLAGVSPTAVSFVLNNREGVSDETRRKVWDIIEKEGYVPNINSRRLSLKKSFNIAFINSDSYAMFLDSFASHTIQAAVQKANSLGYHIMLVQEKTFESSEAFRTLGEGNLDGAVVMHDIPENIYTTLSQKNIPMVSIDSHNQEAAYPKVVVNYEHLAYKACSYLLEQNHRDIAYMGVSYLPDFYQYCYHGYKRALEEEQIQIKDNWVVSVQDDGTNIPDAAKKVAVEMFRQEQCPSAVFCANDLVAIGLIGGLNELGISVPEDVSVISIDDISMAQFFVPPLTTVHVDGAEMGDKAIEVLHDMIENNAVHDTVEMEEGDLIIRKSVKKYSN